MKRSIAGKRSGKPHLARDYRKLLRTKLKASNLAILLLSRDFQWSRYCQSEAGAVATLEISSIGIIIPPAELSDVSRIAPVLDGYDVVVANQQNIAAKPHQFVEDLRIAVMDRLHPPACALAGDAEQTRLILQLEEQLNMIVQDYEIRPNERELFEVWPSITKHNPLARKSIVENIKRSLRNNTPRSNLSFVGVSLKFSLELLTQALEEFVAEYKSGKTARRKQKKILAIQLVHMDDNSHILHALNDAFDIQTIRDKLNIEGPSLFDRWQAICDDANIILEPISRKRIDYIPPRVGILIDDESLYEGACAFDRAGAVFHLLVGERPYFFFHSSQPRKLDTTGQRAINEFKTYLQVYGENRFNGVELKSDFREWVFRLENSIDSYPNAKEVVLISQSATKFQQLVGHALRRGRRVKIYIQRPTSATGGTQVMISTIRERIEREISQSSCGIAEIYYYDFVPTFRAALIGDEILGVQLYVHSDEKSRVVEPGALRLIATKYSSEFVALRDGLIGTFLQSPEISQTPDDVIDCRQKKRVYASQSS